VPAGSKASNYNVAITSTITITSTSTIPDTEVTSTALVFVRVWTLAVSRHHLDPLTKVIVIVIVLVIVIVIALDRSGRPPCLPDRTL
jgi:hypothetical protein